jgi:YggT family protein
MSLTVRVISVLFDLYTLALLLRVLGSWLLASGIRFPLWAYSTMHFLDRITSPLLNPIRRVIPAVAGLDLSPIIAVMLLQIVERLLISALL